MLNLMIYCSPQLKKTCSQLMARVLDQIPLDNFTSCRSLDGLSVHLKNVDNRSQLALLVTSSHDELIRLSDLFTGINHMDIVLIVPDEEEATMKQAAKLFPRYTCTLDGSVDDIISVLQRMADRSKERTQIYIN